ncbi:MAG: hypothetical protein JOY93_06675 [Acidobacteriales bacterium]|nr:hypothetical protein [Terriglobales bacterium]
MAGVVQGPQHDFWRPPVAATPDGGQIVAAPLMDEACDGCGAEFMTGSRFCYVCGAARGSHADSAAPSGWAALLRLLRPLQFQNVKEWVGLPSASLIAFLIGMGCCLAAMLVGVIHGREVPKLLTVQLWRLQWLVAAVAAFLAGCLLKRA